MNARTRTLVTGATGFLGRYVVDELKECDLVLLGRSIATLQAARCAESGGALVETDYSEQHLVECLREVSAVVHLAAIRPDQRSARFADFGDNIAISENLFRACAATGVRNVVFASTRFVYSDRVNSLPFVEQEAVEPENLYSISKLTCEKLGLMLDLDLKCLRLAQLVGVGEREGHMLMTFINAAREGRDLAVFGQGAGVREYLYVKDAARAVAAAVRAPRTRGIFNVGSGTGTSHLELAQAVADVFGGGRSRVKIEKEKQGDSRIYLMDSTKARSELNWQPQFTLRDALTDMQRIYES